MADIVYIDDDPTGFMALSADAGIRITDFVFDQRDQHLDALEAAKSANVWLFDFFLIASDRGEYTDENGLSLFQKWKAAAAGRPTTVVVSSDLEKAVGEPLGPIQRHHVVAQRHGVEWIGDKSEATYKRVVALADAAAMIAENLKPSTEPDSLGTYKAERLIFDVLRAPKEAEWANSAQRQVDRARPPREVPTSAEAATARSIIGWLLAHVLPYPSFLLTDAQAALRLQMTPASFRSICDAIWIDRDRVGYRGLFAACRYEGPLFAFLGRRWWRAAIDDLAWHLSQEQEGLRPILEKLAGGATPEWLQQAEPVLVSDADLVETDEVAEAADCVRVSDEDFPANVDPAWVLIATAAENKLLAAKVVYEDRELLSSVR